MAGVAGFIAALSVCVFLTVKLPLLMGFCHYDIQNITDKKAGDAFKNDQKENEWRNFRICEVSDPLEAVTPDMFAAWMAAHSDEITQPKP